ncbi:FUSC family protein [Providencia huaxiensis]|uniref:FUSC family protein n=1 Tax=Providencia huaxiensis TaxID=2027290 RepID=UPI0034DD3C03
MPPLPLVHQFAALFIAQYLELVHPNGQAMTVWASAQPWREKFTGKSWWRFVGTVCGVVCTSLIQLHLIHPLLFIIGLASWLVFAVVSANYKRGFVAYGTFLAGYLPVMVSMLSVHITDNLL